MYKNKKGFTLVELLSVIILLIVIIIIAIPNLSIAFENGVQKALVDEAFVMSEGVINKYSDDRISKTYTADVFGGNNNSHRCYTLKSLIGKYVNKSNSKKYHGSIEICTASNCTYRTKIWMTNGEYYLNGNIVDKNLSINDVEKSQGTEYFDSCGVDPSGVGSEWEYDYNGFEESFIAKSDGIYAIEAWGAQGGNRGGKGGYVYTEIELKKGDILYVTVGGAGTFKTYDRLSIATGGFNGGGRANYHSGGGGGATHIALKSGSISSLDIDDIIAVAGGGGGGWEAGNNAINGGGNCNSNSSVCFQSGTYGKVDGIGAGGGLYTSNGVDPSYIQNVGGKIVIGSASGCSTCGGTGYIGNPLTKNGIMYVLNGPTDSNERYKTVSSTKYSADPISGHAKMGNGYARITYLGVEGYNKIFPYNGTYYSYSVPDDGVYRLEAWGAQGGASGGNGGYSRGEISLTKDTILYVYVGGQGSADAFSARAGVGGFNGGGNGGNASSDWGGGAGGGGATHIATESGLLSELSNKVDSILIVAGGGGAGYTALGLGDGTYGGAGGGFKGSPGVGSKSYGGSQTSGYAFGQGATGLSLYYGNGGSGGGFYGGFTDQEPGGERTGGSGGSGYIGNPLLTNKVMYCYRCSTSNATDTKTISTECVDSSARSNCSRTGNGYAKISYVGPLGN